MKDRIARFLKRLPSSRAPEERAPPDVPDSPAALVYVHIGKCGGRSLWDAINHSPVVTGAFDHVVRVHVARPPVLAQARYLVVLRNPIERALSAFNWRYKLVVEEGVRKARFPREREVLMRHGTLNALAEALYDGETPNEAAARDFRAIHHLREDIAFYLSDLLDVVAPGQIFAVLTTEFLDTDIEAILGIRNDRRTHENRSRTDGLKLALSDTARANLRRFLVADYAAAERLLDIKGIRDRRRAAVLG